ncbi:unnamed protein product, partial [Diatraea saccharalis]
MMQCNLPEKLVLSGNLAENWRVFKQALDIYLVAAGLEEKSDKRKLAIFLNFVGEEGLKIYNNFNLKKEEDTFENVLQEFEKYCQPKKNVLYSRYLFYKRQQMEGEPFDKFLTEVTKLVKDCSFKIEEEALRDKLVLGTSDTRCQSKLLVEGELSLDEVIKRLRVAELDRKQIQEIQLKESNSLVVDAVNKSKALDERVIKCKWCGQQHVAKLQKCPARGKECTKCRKLNHFAKVCYTKLHTVRAVNNNELNNSSGEEYYCGSVLHITDCLNICWEEKLLIENSIYVKFKLDTGSEVNLIPYQVYNKLLKLKKLSLNKCKVRLNAYNKSSINVYGTVMLEIKLGSKSYFIDFIVTESGYLPTLGKDTCVLLGLIERKQVNNIKTETSGTIDKSEVIHKFSDVFTGSGRFPELHELKLKPDSEPVSKPPHRVPIKLKEKLKIELERLCHLGVISKQKEPTEWINRIVIVEKDEDSIRVCLDPKALNKCILKKYYEIPTINDLKTKIGKAKFFSVLDLKESFWQIGLSEDSKKLCTFSTVFGTYSFNVLPFGLDVSAEIFQENCEKHFNGIDNIFIYIDDFLIYGRTKAEHDIALNRVLSRARELNIKFNLKKFQYLPNTVKYFGHEIKDGCLLPDRKKIEAISNYDIPKDKKSLQRFLGMVNYLRDFIPNLSEITFPLRELLKKDVVFQWNDNVHSKCIEDIKCIIISPPVLQNFDSSLPIVIQTDSSQSAIGSVLIQNNHPIAFASKSLSKTECEYGQIDKEFLAVLFACQKFHYYIYGRHITIQTDHQPLVALMNKELHAISSQRL